MLRVEVVNADWAAERVKVDKLIIDRSLEIWAIWRDEALVFVGGVVKDSLIGDGRVWLVLGEGFTSHKREALRACKGIMRAARNRFGHLISHSDPGAATKFAEFCGFTIVGQDGPWMRGEL